MASKTERLSQNLTKTYQEIDLYSPKFYLSKWIHYPQSFSNRMNKKKEIFLKKISNEMAEKALAIKKELISFFKEELSLFNIGNYNTIEVDRIRTDFKREIIQLYGEFHSLYLQNHPLYHSLTLAQFLDILSQVMTFALFWEDMVRQSKKVFPSNINPNAFITRTMGILQSPSTPLKIKEIVQAIDCLKEKQNPDFYFYFNEYFLSYYNAEERKNQGVFYTPKEVINFIIASLKEQMNTVLERNDSYIQKVKVLDFAFGTGAFLSTAIQNLSKIQSNTPINNSNPMQYAYYGIEYLPSSYLMGNAILSNLLALNEVIEHPKSDETYLNCTSKACVSLYLADALEIDRNLVFQQEFFGNTGANQMYPDSVEDFFPMIIGNPPYSNYSNPPNKWLYRLLSYYKDGIKDKKINLNDDYIKFIRLSHWIIQEKQMGIIGIITNNSYIEGITRRGMREKILQDFDEIYVLNLHGNSKKKEGDSNIFNIQVGVAILFLIKHPNISRSPADKRVYYYSTHKNSLLSKEDKLNLLSNNTLRTISWDVVHPKPPYYWFHKKESNDLSKQKSSRQLTARLTDIFKVYASGIKTDRDGLFIDVNKDKLEHRMKCLFSKDYDQTFIDKYRVKNSSSYPLLERIKHHNFDKANLYSIHYRPFDYRYIYYKIGITSRPAQAVMKHLLNHNNLCLCFARDNSYIKNPAIFITSGLINIGLIGSQTYVAPLYLYPEESLDLWDKSTKGIKQKPMENFQRDFKQKLEQYYNQPIPLEDLLFYIYGYFHSNRFEYEKEHSYDFAHIHFPKDVKEFISIKSNGRSWFKIHNLSLSDFKMQNRPDKRSSLLRWNWETDHPVYCSKLTYDGKQNRVWIDKNHYLFPITAEIWNYSIGIYPVLKNYLSVYKNSLLTREDLDKINRLLYIIKSSLQLLHNF